MIVDAEENHPTLKENAAEKTTLCVRALEVENFICYFCYCRDIFGLLFLIVYYLFQKSTHNPKDFVVIGDDTGLEIESLNGEPGIFFICRKKEKRKDTRRYIKSAALDHDVVQQN